MCEDLWVWRPHLHQVYADMNSRWCVGEVIIENDLVQVPCLLILFLTLFLQWYFNQYWSWNFFLECAMGNRKMTWFSHTKIYAVNGLVIKGLLLSVYVRCSSQQKAMENTWIRSELPCWLSLYKDLFCVPHMLWKSCNDGVLDVHDQVLVAGGYKSGFGEKLPDASPMSSRTDAEWLQDSCAAGQAWAN